jgi:hypothetical protein
VDFHRLVNAHAGHAGCASADNQLMPGPQRKGAFQFFREARRQRAEGAFPFRAVCSSACKALQSLSRTPGAALSGFPPVGI